MIFSIFFTGIQGPTGPAGPPGKDFVFTDDIAGQIGDLNITKGDVGPDGAKGEKGDRGDQGPPGLKGNIGSTGDRGKILCRVIFRTLSNI